MLTPNTPTPVHHEKQFITMMQISQMVVGVGVAVFYILKLRAGEECAVDKELLIACGIMYVALLFNGGCGMCRWWLYSDGSSSNNAIGPLSTPQLTHRPHPPQKNRYSTYLYLFVEFAVKRFILSPAKGGSAGAGKAGGAKKAKAQ